LAVAPAARGQGVGRALVQRFRFYNIRDGTDYYS